MNAREKALYETLLEHLQQSGARLTAARKDVISILVTTSEPLSIQEIVEKALADEASVYRIISLFKKLQLVEEISSSKQPVRYAATHEHHHHIICTVCGHTVHIPCAENIHTSIPTHRDFMNILNHTVTYEGVCTKCIA